MKKFFLILYIFILSIIPVKAIELPIEITGEAAIVYNLDSNQIIYEKNPDIPYPLASLTKIMNAYTVINNVENLDKKITITYNDLYNLWGYTQAGLNIGDKLSYTDLLYAMMLPSGADASQALAYNTSTTTEEFVALMNKEAKELGLRNATFADSYGGNDNNIATAREILRLTKECLKNDTFNKIFKTTSKTLSNGLQVTNYTRSIATFHGYNSDYITGSKSGFTQAAGLNLVSTVKVNDTNYLIVILKCNINEYTSQHVIDTYEVINYLESKEFETRTIIKNGTKIKRIPVERSTISEYVVYADQDIKVTLPVEDFNNLKIDYNIADKILTSYVPGDNLGYIDIKLNDETLASYNVYLQDQIYTLAEVPRNIIIVILVSFFAIIIIFISNTFNRNKKKKK